MAEEFYGTIDATNGLEMNESFIHNNWESGDLLMVTKNDNGTIIFAKVTVDVEFVGSQGRIKYHRTKDD